MYILFFCLISLNLYFLISILLHIVGFITITFLIPLLNFISYDFKIVITYVPISDNNRYPISPYYIGTADDLDSSYYIESIDSPGYNESPDSEQNIPEICYPDDSEPDDSEINDSEPDDNEPDDTVINNNETDTEDESEKEYQKRLVKNKKFKKFNSILKYIRKIKKT
jgi:hypothetical protein